MLPETVSIVLGLDDDDDIEALRVLVARKLKVKREQLPHLRLLKRSIDARHGRIRFQILIGLGEPEKRTLGAPDPTATSTDYRVAIVGAGPAGLFCAYQLAREGVRSIVLDRGKSIQPRRRDLKLLNQEGVVDGDSNYCFGEGGAGTYSDGKLYTRSHKRGDVRDVIEILARHGAPEKITTDARPHIGSNVLPKVITSMREMLEAVGVEFRFNARVIDFEMNGSQTAGVVLEDGEVVGAHAVVLATGHSANDVLELLRKRDVALEPKAFALGVRIEHPQSQINRHQYGKHANHPKLSAAPYRLATQVDGRGVFSFCMCPGGWIVPAATEPGSVVVNGMSLSKRDSKYANSGLVVAIEPEDLAAIGRSDALDGIVMQRAIEKAAGQAGGGQLRAPACRVNDFVAKRVSADLPETSYIPGLTPANLDSVLNVFGIDIASYLRKALRDFDKKMPGYISPDAILVGVETRTSSPVRIPRDTETLVCPDMPGLYPCGEGAGYAGGIVSAALDGIRVARAIVLARVPPE